MNEKLTNMFLSARRLRHGLMPGVGARGWCQGLAAFTDYLSCTGKQLDFIKDNVKETNFLSIYSCIGFRMIYIGVTMNKQF